jgi:curved DNA-binding protein CbpA
MSETTHYEALGASPEATREQLRQQYLRLARQLHPDRFMTAPDAERQVAERRMREVTVAWGVLGDEQQRARYDAHLARVATARAPATPTFRPPPRMPSAATLRGSDSHLPPLTYDPTPPSPDEVVAAHRMSKRVPIFVALAILLGIFVGSAYAGTHASDAPNGMRATTTVPEAPPGSGR